MFINNVVAATFIMGITFNPSNAKIDSILNTKIESHYNKCLMDMINFNFKRNATVTIFSANHPEYSQMETVLVKDIFASLNFSVFLYTQMNQKKLSPLGVRRNIIVILGKKSLKVVLGVLHSFYIWDSKVVFMVVVENLKQQKRVFLEDIENHIRSYDITSKVIVEHITTGSDLEPITEHYISNPSKLYRAKKPFEKLSKIGSCKLGSPTFQFNKKLIENAELRIGVIHAPPFMFIVQPEKVLLGGESKLVSAVTDSLNMTAQYQYYSNMDNLGDIHVSDGNDIHGSGMLNDLILNNIDIAVCNIVVSERVLQSLGISMAYSLDRITWIVPEPRTLLKLPFFPFIYDFQITLLLISTYAIFPYLAFMATNHFHKTSHDECTRYKTYRGTCISFFAMATGSTVDIFPKTIRMRFFFFVWLFYTYHLNMYFSSTLIWFFGGEQYSPALETFDEVISSGMKLGIDSRTYNYFKDQLILSTNYTERKQSIYDKIIICNSTSFCLSKVTQVRNFSMTLSHNYFTFVKHLFKDIHGNNLLTSIPEAIVSIPIGIIFKKGFRLEHKMNGIVLRINEAGLFNHWIETTKLEMKSRRIVTTVSDENIISANYTLTFYDLKMVFFSIIIELFVCFLVFICELITHWWKNKVKKLDRCSATTNELFEYVN